MSSPTTSPFLHTRPSPQTRVGLLIPTVEGGLLCHQEMSREAARRAIVCPEVISLALPSSAAIDLPKLLREGQHDAAADMIAAGIERLYLAGASFAAMTANLIHLIFDDIRSRSRLPLISIVDTVALHAASRGFHTVGILGTQPIMESDLYPNALATHHIKTLTPPKAEREFIHHTIFAELLSGIVTQDSTRKMQAVVQNLREQGAQAIALVCTELGMILDEEMGLPMLDSTKLLAHAALEWQVNRASH